MGDAGKGAVTVALVVSIVLMVIGYRGADGAVYWGRDPMWVGINNLLMLLAFYVFAASAAKGDKIWLGTKLRHPQLTAVIIFGVAHLLVNGDTASFVLFGGLIIWAVAEMLIINAQEGPWQRPGRAPVRKEIVAAVVAVVVTVVVMVIHHFLGVTPWG
jgi:uncharacterized membrane protein